MDHSYGSDISVTCGQCGTSLQATVWVIIDTEQRPDLLQALVTGALNSYVCPQCGYRDTLPHAIVIYGALPRHPVIVSHVGDSLPDEAGGLAFYWITVLGEQLGKPSNWLDDLIAAGLPIVPRKKLAAILQPAPPDPVSHELQEALADLISSKTWLDVYDLVTKQPVLLTPQAEQTLDSLAVRLARENRAEDAELFLRRRDVLRSARGVGVDQAIRDVTGMTIDELRAETKLLNWDMAELLQGMRDAGLNPFDSDSQRRYLAEHPELAARLNQAHGEQ